jgi:hypothetical protein
MTFDGIEFAIREKERERRWKSELGRERLREKESMGHWKASLDVSLSMHVRETELERVYIQYI